jgi:transposase
MPTLDPDDEVEAVVRGAAGRLVLLYLPTYSPWLNPIEMLWRHFRRELTHCELFQTVKALLTAAREFFERYNQEPYRTVAKICYKASFPQLSTQASHDRISIR